MSRPVVAVSTFILVVLTGVAAWLHVRPQLENGLRRSIYQTGAFNGAPILQRVSADLDLAFVDRDPSLPRHFFSVRWEGLWFVDRDRVVDVLAGGDDRVVVTIDGRVMADRTVGGAGTVERAVPLTAGVHRLTVLYEQHGGGYSLNVQRALDGGAPGPFDGADLFPDGVSVAQIQSAQRDRAIRRTVTTLWLAVVGLTGVWRGGPFLARRARREIDAWTRRLAGPADGVRAAPTAVAVLFSALLLAIATTGPDYGQYIDWTNAFLLQDVFFIRTQVGSPLGLPLTQWSHGPGLMFAFARTLLGPMIAADTSAMVVGWLAAMLFWFTALRILGWAAKGNPVLTACAAAAMFVGTHAGFYTHHHASESLALALVVYLTWAAIERRSTGLAECALVGAVAGLLVITRVNLAIYAVPALVAQAARLVSSSRGRSWFHLPLSLTALAGPVAIAVAQVAFVNRWTTGAFTKSAYVFGDGQFKSVDWLDPEMLAVLAHPWHGLLTYHPLYALGFAALVWLCVTTSSRPGRLLCVAGIAVVAVNVLVQAAWYVWWLGTDTFGSRGSTALSIVLMPALTRVVAEAYGRNRWQARTWLLLMIACAIWSYLLMLQGASQFLTYADLGRAQRAAFERLMERSSLAAFGLAALPVLVWTAWLYQRRSPLVDRWLYVATPFLGLLSFGYLFDLAGRRTAFEIASLLFPAILIVAIIWSLRLLMQTFREWRSTRPSPEGHDDSFVRWGVAGMCVVTTTLFTILAVRTEQRLASGNIPRGRFTDVATFHRPEVVASYREYGRVPGFEDKKEKLRRFLKLER